MKENLFTGKLKQIFMVMKKKMDLLQNTECYCLKFDDRHYFVIVNSCKYLTYKTRASVGTSEQMSRVMRKPTMWLQNRSTTNRAVQAQKLARSLNFLTGRRGVVLSA